MKSIIALLLFMANLAVAQSEHTTGSIYLAPGIQQFSFSNLNSVLTQAGFHKVPLAVGFGSGGFGQSKHLRVGGEGYYFSGSAKMESTTTELQGGWGYFYVGYKMGNNLWRFIPALGLGWGGSSVSAIRTSNSSLNDLINNQPNTSLISIGGTFLHTAITIERDLPGQQYLAIKGTYNRGFSSKNEWTAPGLTTSVTDSFSGFQFSLIFGFTLQ
jgi:hypothetical protein